jgi:hypothetical protein
MTLVGRIAQVALAAVLASCSSTTFVASSTGIGEPAAGQGLNDEPLVVRFFDREGSGVFTSLTFVVKNVSTSALEVRGDEWMRQPIYKLAIQDGDHWVDESPTYCGVGIDWFSVEPNESVRVRVYDDCLRRNPTLEPMMVGVPWRRHVESADQTSASVAWSEPFCVDALSSAVDATSQEAERERYLSAHGKR